MLRSHSRSDTLIFLHQLGCTSSCADVGKRRKMEPSLEFYNIYVTGGEDNSIENICKRGSVIMDHKI